MGCSTRMSQHYTDEADYINGQDVQRSPLAKCSFDDKLDVRNFLPTSQDPTKTWYRYVGS